ncbi:MAG: hypothetical protein IT221_09610 [Fluviicola sp.]|nr:hypothetical protein [Fluviicola sp.]
MWLLSAKSTFSFELNQSEDELRSLIEQQLIGKRKFEIETLFGKNEATYEGTIDSKIYSFERLNESIKMTIAPKCKIALRSFNENQTLVQVTCKLSMYWVVFLYFIYCMLFLGVTLKSIYTNDFFTIYTVLKLVGGLILFNAIIFGTHYNELGHYKSILSRICGANAK